MGVIGHGDEHPSRRSEYELAQRRRAQDEEDARVTMELELRRCREQLQGAVDALAQIAAVLSRQETIVGSDATLVLRGIVGDALIAARGQS
jgi:hypothetical protein